MRARVVSTLLGVAFFVAAGVVAPHNAAALTALPVTHLLVLVALAVLGALLIDPGHVGTALASLVGIARQAKAVKDDAAGGAP